MIDCMELKENLRALRSMLRADLLTEEEHKRIREKVLAAVYQEKVE